MELLHQIKSLFLIIILFSLIACTLPRPHNDNLWTTPSCYIDTDYLDSKKEINMLVLSGGGANGAWGAGVLHGLRESNRYLDYDVVTGISTGSLIANFAFLDDPDYDSVLKDSYFYLKSNDVFGLRPYTLMVFNDSLSDSDNLKNKIAQLVSDDFIDRIALIGREKNKRLYIGTTNLDRGEFVFWDMVDIASKKKYDLYRSILLASSAVPILYPPVFINNNMNVDGGVSGSIFVPNDILHLNKIKNVYVVYNGKPNAVGRIETKNNLKDLAIRNLLVMNERTNILSLMLLESNPTVNFYLSCANDVDLVSFKFDQVQVQKIYNAGEDFGKNKEWERNLNKYLK